MTDHVKTDKDNSCKSRTKIKPNEKLLFIKIC